MIVRTLIFFAAVTFGLCQTEAAPRCESLMNTLASDNISKTIEDQDAALEYVKLQHFYESAIRFVQKKITVHSIRSTTAQQQRRKLNLAHFLNAGNHTDAIDIFRRQFDDVELAFFIIKHDEVALQNANLKPADKLKLEKRLRRYRKSFAENYGEYVDIRTYLESLSENSVISPGFLIAGQKTLKYLGVHKFSETHPDFAALKIPEARVELADVKSLYRGNSLHTRLKLWGDFKSEIISVLKYIVSSEILIQTADNVFSRFPPKVADKLKEITGIMRSAQLRNRLLPSLIEIESLPADVNLRLEELRRKNSITRNDELLVTYVRTVDFTDTWIALKAHAAIRAAETGNTIHKNFYERMLKAETRAAKLNDISLYEQVSNIDVLATLIQCGIIIKVSAPHVFSSISDLMNFLAGSGLVG